MMMGGCVASAPEPSYIIPACLDLDVEKVDLVICNSKGGHALLVLIMAVWSKS